MEIKVCKKCKKELPANSEYFNKGYIKKSGEQSYSSYCKICQAKLKKDYYEKNKEKYKERSRENAKKWREKNRLKERNYAAKKQKRCANCNKIKPIKEFHKDRTSKDGYCSICRTCRYIKDREYLKKYPNYSREYYEKNIEKIKEYQYQYRLKNKKPLKPKICPVCGKEFIPESNNQKYCTSKGKGACARKAQYQRKDKDKHRKEINKWKKNNPEKVREARRQDKIKNRDRILRARRKNEKKRMENDLKFRLKQKMKASIHLCLKNGKGGKPTEEVLGYTIKELIKHLENQFEPGMSWNNYGKWHIDHIIPINFFEFNSHKDIEFKICWHIENLRPLWGHENVAKHDKLDYKVIKNIQLTPLFYYAKRYKNNIYSQSTSHCFSN
jgi:hypothetical protein